jgi:hypothetical protein
MPTLSEQGQASPITVSKPTKIAAAVPPSSNGNSTAKTAERRNGSASGTEERRNGSTSSDRAEVTRKHPVLTPTDNRKNPIASLSNISTDNRLSESEKLGVVIGWSFVSLCLIPHGL